MIKLSIVIPAYNEEAALNAGKLCPVIDLVQRHTGDMELIMIDDGSTDGTTQAACRALNGIPYCFTYRSEHWGKAAAIMIGMRMALGDLILCADLDQAVPINDAQLLQYAIEMCGADVAVGSRGLSRPGAPLSRYILSVGQVMIKRLLLGLPITDTQCGFKMWSRSTAMAVIDRLVIYNRERIARVDGPNTSSGWDVEMLLVAMRLGYQVAEIPVSWTHQASRRVSFGRDARRGLSDLWRIFAADIAGLYPHANKSTSNIVLTDLQPRQQR